MSSKPVGIFSTINENGFLVEPKNVPELIEKLLKALKLNENEIKTIRENNIKLARKKHSWESLVRQIEKIYLDCYN